jgi:poly-gamma-glutamate synthesis protein (capsule biosynthesis protein)
MARRRRRSLLSLTIFLAAVMAVVVGSRVGFSLVDHGSNAAPKPTLAAGDAATTPSPTTTPSSSHEKRGSLLIHGAGDVSLDPGYISTYASHGFDYAWSGLDGLFLRDDLTVVNVECPVSNKGSQLTKQFSFHGDPAALPAMRRAGVEVGNLSNNHAYDRGPDALVDTRQNLLDAGIRPVGAGRDADEAAAPAIFHLSGWTVAVVGIDEVIDPDYEVATATKPGTAAGHDFSAALREVRSAAARADLVVVDIHWGVELDTQPRATQVDEAHRLVDAGADVIFGGHSHRLQPMAMYHGRPIFYSLGNFVWPNFSAAGSTTGVAEVRVTPSGRFTAKLLPAFIEAPGHPILR